MKKIILTCVSFVLLGLITNPAFASLCLGTPGSPCVVQDTENNAPAVKNWRKAELIKRIYHGNTSGLNNMWVSGSAAPSAQGFATIAEHVKETTGKRVKKMIDVDLCQESHGYLNNNSITLTVQNNWININKTRGQALSAEQAWLKTLSRQKNIANVLTSDQFKENSFFRGKTIPIASINNEKEIASKAGFEYFRLMVSDHLAPRNKEVDQFVTLVSTLPEKSWLHIHCRGGEGRTTTFMAMYDMLRNADKVSLNDIIKRQASVIPHQDLFDTHPSEKQFTQLYENRKEFLTLFYKFAQARLKGYSGNWSAWINKKGHG